MLLLILLTLGLLKRRLTVEPNADEGDPAKDRNPNTSDPDPPGANLPTSWIFIVCEMADRDLPFNVNVGQKWPLEVDSK